MDEEPPFQDAPTRDWPGEADAPGLPTVMVPGDVCREGLWVVVRNPYTEDVERVWDAPNPGLLN
jgi:hypothetical protein